MRLYRDASSAAGRMDPMKRWALLVGCLLLCPSVARAGDQAPEIKDVQTLAELRRLDPVRVGDWNVQAGLGGGGVDAGPWAVVYCHVTYVGTDEKPRLRPPEDVDPDQALGPVVVRVSWGQERVVDHVKAQA